MSEQVLKLLVEEVQALRTEVRQMKVVAEEIDHFQHREVRPEYLAKLKRIAVQKGKTYRTVAELERDLR